MKLFVTDLDGTLLAADQSIHPRDLAAIRSARARGVLVTIATGRLLDRTHPVARAIGVELPFVCADGGVVACAVTQRVLHRHALPVAVVDRALANFARHDVPSFVFTDEVIHGCERGRSHHAYLRGWSDTIATHLDVSTSGAFMREPSSAVAVLGIATPARIAAVEESLALHDPAVAVDSFAGAGGRVLRIRAQGVSKGAALGELARRLGVAPERIAVAGDFWNDLSMFALAGRSFAMPHAPAEVRAAATHALDHDIAKHGAFADALEAWIHES
jgi:Cof subfamily protein (haloacid dehalogenase superfamily)